MSRRGPKLSNLCNLKVRRQVSLNPSLKSNLKNHKKINTKEKLIENHQRAVAKFLKILSRKTRHLSKKYLQKNGKVLKSLTA